MTATWEQRFLTALIIAFAALVMLVSCGQLAEEVAVTERVPDSALFIFTCCHCNAIVLATTQLRDAEAKRLANHLSTTHPNVRFYTPKLGPLLDHFVVRQSPAFRG